MPARDDMNRDTTMRNLLLGASAITASIALSGCSFLGIGQNSHKHTSYPAAHHGTYGAHHAPKGCGTQACLSRWNLEGGLGPAFLVDGTAVTGSSTNEGSPAEIRNISMGNAYDEGIRAELGGSYALTPNRKVTVLGHYAQADGDDFVDWGTVGGEQLTGSLSEYESYGVELGLRQYFAPRKGVILNSVRPYVEGRVGVTQLEDVQIENVQLGGAAFNGGNPVPFYESGLVGTAAGLVGIETPLTRYSTIGLETGLRYTGKPDTDTSALGPGNPLGGINNGGSSLSVPIMLRGRYRF